MTDLVVDRLRIRGPGARRLAEIAARLLPERLDRALADVGDLEVGTVAVRLDVDFERDDPELIATLWAEAIRAEVLALGAHRSPPGRASGSQPPAPAHVLRNPDEVAAAVRRWLASPDDASHVLPREVLSLAEPAFAALVATSLGVASWAALVLRLGALPWLPSRAARTTDEAEQPAPASGPVPGPRPGPDGVLPICPGDDASAPSALAPPQPSDDPLSAASSSSSLPPLEPNLRRLLESLAELVHDDRGEVDLTLLTRAAGLVLLWPWLGDLGREAERGLPFEPPHVARAGAFAHLADPEQPDLADDPLVRFLAGVPDGEPVAPGLDLPDPTREAAERVLTAFAAVLPGFAASTGRFVRDEWVLRVGLLDRTTSPTRMDAATHPLDVVLAALPYPLTLFKLPWSDPLTVRFRP